MELACLDLEGVLIPEIWINFAERTGIDALRATTRDIPDYDVLMKQRLLAQKKGSTVGDAVMCSIFDNSRQQSQQQSSSGDDYSGDIPF